MKEFTTIAELAVAKTREEIVKWAAEMQKCPYDFEGEAFDESVCKEGEDSQQCNECWLAALKGIKCKDDEVEEKTKRRTTKKKGEMDSSLAAKNSNAGVKALKQLSLSMTKEEFMKHTVDANVCPSNYGFPNSMANCQNHAISSQCKDCWSTIVDSLEFKVDVIDEVRSVDEVPTVDTTELVAPVKNDVKVLAHMDKLVEEVKNFKAQQVQWDALLKEKIAEATAKVEEEKAKLQRAIDYNMSQIVVEFPQVEAKETKTQKKISLVSGEVILKKSTEKLEADKEKLLTYFKENNLNDYIKVKEEANWSDFKKTLIVTDGTIVDGNGEVVIIDGLTVVTTDEKLEVK